MKSNDLNFEKFLECVKTINEENKKREVVECDAFKNYLEIQTFLKYHAKTITDAFYTTFIPYETESNDFKIYFSCIEKDKDKILLRIK